MRVLLGCLVLASCVAADDKKDEKIDAKKLVGEWAAKGRKGEAVEYTADGRLLTRIDQNGKTLRADGGYRVDGPRIIFRRNAETDAKESTATVTTLTDTELVVKDESGGVQKFERVGDKKDEKIDPAKLLGKWVTKEREGTAIEFLKGGKLVLHRTVGDKETRFDGTYTLDGTRLSVVATPDGKEEKSAVTIKSLADEEMVVVPEPGKEVVMTRVKGK